MTDKVEEGTIEYVTKDDLREFQATINDRLGDIEAAFHRNVEDVKRDSISTMKQVVDERLEAEARQRRDEVESLKGELREVSAKMDAMTKEFGDVNKGVSEIKGLMNSFQSVLESRDKTDRETHRRIEERIDTQSEVIKVQSDTVKSIENDVDLLTSANANLTGDVKLIRRIIHGDPDNKDDAPSLFGSLNELKNEVRQGFIQANAQLSSVSNGISQNRQDIAAIVEARANEKAQWEQRWNAIKEVGKAALSNKWVQLAIGAVLASIVLGVFPELRPAIVQQFLDNVQAGG